jgi:hypothetical protein
MPPLKVRRIELAANNSANQINKLRDQFRIDSEVVSSASKKLTLAVFGKPMTPVAAVEKICTDVRDGGLEAVLKYTEQFDKVKLKPNMIRVEHEELEAWRRSAASATTSTRSSRVSCTATPSCGCRAGTIFSSVTGRSTVSASTAPAARPRTLRPCS